MVSSHYKIIITDLCNNIFRYIDRHCVCVCVCVCVCDGVLNLGSMDINISIIVVCLNYESKMASNQSKCFRKI